MFLLLLNACSTADIRKNYKLTEGQTTGVLLVSITHSGEVLGFYPPTCSYTSIRTGDSGWIGDSHSVSLLLDDTLVKSEEYTNIMGSKVRQGKMVAIELPSGYYKLDTCVLKYFNGMYSATYRNRNMFNMPFTVYPGKAVYIGNITVNLSENYINIGVRDERGRDMEIVTRNWPGIGSDDIIYKIASIRNNRY
jgi:hypothetical protein